MIRTAEGIAPADLRAAMIASFADYAVPMQPSQVAFDLMMRQRSFAPGASFVVEANGAVVAIWLVGRRGPDAYLIASGTRPDHRGRGLARAMAERCLSGLAQDGIRSFSTEVMDGNAPATALYLGLGMAKRRPLDCHALSGISAAAEVADVTWQELAPHVRALWDWSPSWQNDRAALSAISGDVRCAALWDDDGLAGYAALIEPLMTLAQIAVRPDRRRTGLGRALVGALAPAGQIVRVINADGTDAGFRAFATALGASPMVGQTELRLDLPAW